MRGHAYKRGKTWTVVYDEPAEDGKRKQRSRGGFRMKDDAEAFLTQTLGAVGRGEYVTPSKTLLGDWLEEWLNSLSREDLTLGAYRIAVRHHITPALGDTPLQQLTAAHCLALYRELRDVKKLKPATIARIHAVLHIALKKAVKYRLVVRNVLDELDKDERPKAGKPKRRTTWTERELRLWNEATKDDRLHAAYRFAAMTGVRRGELLGLSWRALDLERGTATIAQTVIPTTGKRWRIKPTTKTDNPHTIALDPRTVEILKDHRDAQNVERALWGDAYQDHDLVFCRENGVPLDPNRFSETIADKMKDAGLPPIRLHDLRHTHATQLMANGVPPRVVQERLGHSDVKITLARYSHVMPGMDREAAENFAARVDG